MIYETHLGSRVSALVDGQMSAIEEERAWAHVHRCPECLEAVEREGWVKRQLACLSLSGPAPLPETLRGSLGRAPVYTAWPAYVAPEHRARRYAGLAALGAGSVGAAMVGVLALSTPAEAPNMERRAPLTNLLRQADGSPTTPASSRRDSGGREETPASVVTTTWMRMGL